MDDVRFKIPEIMCQFINFILPFFHYMKMYMKLLTRVDDKVSK